MQEANQRREELRTKLNIDDMPKPQSPISYPTENRKKHLERLRNENLQKSQ